MAIQILPARKSFGQEFGRGLGEGVSSGLTKSIEKSEERKETAKDVARIKELTGEDTSGLSKENRQKFFAEAMQGKREQKKSKLDMELDNLSYPTIEKTFGREFADLWKVSPVGGRTEMVKQGIDTLMRGEDLNEVLKGVKKPDQQKFSQQEPGEFSWPDYSKPMQGYTPKDWKDERKTWRKENAPVFQDITNKVNVLEQDKMGIAKLDKLNRSKKLPEGLLKSLINPETGEFYGMAQLAEVASPEAQEWIKEVARFQNRAKDAFGSRVTNFDLQSYMKQFPNLMNTTEGRSRIIRMMNINNELDSLHNKSLRDVYRRYGLNGIPQEEAERLASEKIGNKVEKLRHEYLGIDEENKDEPAPLSGQMVDVMGPDGQMYEVDQSEVEKLPEGFRVQ